MANDEPDGAPIPAVPVKDSLTGSTQAENILHVRARVAFMNHLLQDKRWPPTFQSWLHRIGIAEHVADLTEGLDDLVVRVGVGSRRQLLHLAASEGLPADFTVASEQEARILQANVDRLNKGLDALQATWDDIDINIQQIAADAIRFVRDDLRIEWPWVAAELVTVFVLSLRNIMVGEKVIINLSYLQPEPEAPTLEMHFKTMNGESAHNAAVRLIKQAFDTLDKLQPAAPTFLPRGRIQSNMDVEEQVDWFYRNKVSHETISGIAKKAGCDRSAIYHGIRRAQLLLSLTPYSF